MSELRARVTSGFGGLAQTYLQWRYASLFHSLLLTLAAGPLLGALGFAADFLWLFLAVNLLAAVLPVSGRWMRRLVLTIVMVTLALRGGVAWFGHAEIPRASLAIWTVMALVAAANALRFALSATAVEREHLYAALSAYMLAGVFFGVFYWVLERTGPGSLVSAGESTPGSFSLATGIYFSFVTLATLGYGDVVPRSEVARGLAIVEAVAGQLYLAVMIAYLVSLYGSGVERGKPS